MATPSDIEVLQKKTFDQNEVTMRPAFVILSRSRKDLVLVKTQRVLSC